MGRSLALPSQALYPTGVGSEILVHALGVVPNLYPTGVGSEKGLVGQVYILILLYPTGVGSETVVTRRALTAG